MPVKHWFYIWFEHYTHAYNVKSYYDNDHKCDEKKAFSIELPKHPIKGYIQLLIISTVKKQIMYTSDYMRFLKTPKNIYDGILSQMCECSDGCEEPIDGDVLPTGIVNHICDTYVNDIYIVHIVDHIGTIMLTKIL
jgi:hypothetical protein